MTFARFIGKPGMTAMWVKDSSQSVVLGTDGQDQITTGPGDASIFAGAGDDGIEAGNGAQFVDAGDGDDMIWAGNGAQTVSGGAGADWIWSGAGAQLLMGGSGDDQIRCRQGSQTVLGGAGHDVIWTDGIRPSSNGTGPVLVFGEGGERHDLCRARGRHRVRRRRQRCVLHGTREHDPDRRRRPGHLHLS